MDILQEINSVRSKLRKMEKAKDKAELELEMLMNRLRDEFGLDSLDKARVLLEEIEKEVEREEAAWKKVKAKFDKSWKAFVLGGFKDPC